MGFQVGCYLKVWKKYENETKTGKVIHKFQCSTSHKNGNGGYDTDFTGFVTLMGNAAEWAPNVKVGDRIKVNNCTVTNNYSKATGKTYTNFTVFEGELISSEDKAADVPEGFGFNTEEGELPF